MNCRCHLGAIRKVRHVQHDGRARVEHTSHRTSSNNAPVAFTESTFFMNSQLRHIAPKNYDNMFIDYTNYFAPSEKLNNQRAVRGCKNYPNDFVPINN